MQIYDWKILSLLSPQDWLSKLYLQVATGDDAGVLNLSLLFVVFKNLVSCETRKWPWLNWYVKDLSFFVWRHKFLHFGDWIVASSGQNDVLKEDPWDKQEPASSKNTQPVEPWPCPTNFSTCSKRKQESHIAHTSSSKQEQVYNIWVLADCFQGR